MKTKTQIRAGKGIAANHSQKLVAVKSNVKGGSLTLNHSQTLIAA